MNTETESRAPERKPIRILVGVVAAIAVAALLVFFGIDIWTWLGDVWNNIRLVPAGFVIVALGFRTVEALLTALSWRNVLQATYPETPIPYRIVLGAFQGGVAINAFTPAQAGTVATFGLLRVTIPGSQLPSLLAGYAVHQLAFTLFAILTYTFLLLTRPEARALGSRLLQSLEWTVSARLFLVMAVLMLIVALAIVAGRAAHGRLRSFREQIAPGAAILRTPRRYLVFVFLPALSAYTCRCLVVGTFLTALSIPATPYSILLVLASNTFAEFIKFTPGGFGTKQALNVVALRTYAPASVATAYSVAQEIFLAAFNIAFGVIVMAWAFGWTETMKFVRERHRMAEQGSSATLRERQ